VLPSVHGKGRGMDERVRAEVGGSGMGLASSVPAVLLMEMEARQLCQA